MNDAGSMLAFFAINVVIWAVFIAVIVIILRGRIREKYQSGLRATDIEHTAHRNGTER